MAICILGRRGVENVLCNYIQYNEPQNTFVNAIILCDESIGVFLARYLMTKCVYANLKLTKLTFSKSKKCFTLLGKEILKNNVSQDELNEYESEISRLLSYTKIYQNVKTSRLLEVITSLSSSKVSNVFIYNYIKPHATLAFIVQEGIKTMKTIESMLESTCTQLIFTCFLPVIDYEHRMIVKNMACKTFSNVIICLDKRELIYTKEDLDSIDYMKIEDSENDNLIAYRFKRETKLNIDL